MKILMIVAGVVVALLILFLIGNAAGFFSGPGIVQEENETVEVPDLRGKTEDEAREELNKLGLGIKVENERQPSNQYDEGEVMSQDPVLLALPVSLFLKIQIIFAKCVSCMEKKIK